MSTTITLKRLKQRGYQSLTDVYIELNPSLCEPPSTACLDFYWDDPLGLS
ncbi:MAG: hypothetical protein KA782_05690 [Flavobacterium sp.]|nr:hypothetical protein [Flavobacterium sp.]MBP7470564.1 hypothetical protein [Flavobacterium sp.]